MLSIEFETSSTGGYAMNAVKIDANECSSEAEAVLEAQKFLRHFNLQQAKLSYNGGLITIRHDSDFAETLQKLFTTSMQVYIPAGADRSGPVVQAETRAGGLIYGIFNDAVRLARMERKPLAFKVSGIDLTAEPTSTAQDIEADYNKKLDALRRASRDF